jgi:predicted ATP-grasp superfamily ATP-dependent carboligase
MEQLEELMPVEGLRDPILLSGYRMRRRAGRLASRIIDYLADKWHAEPIARIDMAPFLDLAIDRPWIRRTETESRIEWPKATVYLSRDAASDRDLLLFSSTEPNFRWKTYVAGLSEYLDGLGVKTLITMRAHPGVVPHTRPAPVYLTANNEDLESMFGVQANRARYEGPGSIAGVFGAKVQSLGWRTAELAVVQPDYFPRMPCAEAMISLLTLVDKALGTTTPIESWRETAVEQREMLDRATAEDSEAQGEVESRERSYDQGEQALEFLSPTRTPPDLPSGEEVANEIERFFQQRPTDE